MNNNNSSFSLVLLVAWNCFVKCSDYNLNGQVDFNYVGIYSNLSLPNKPYFYNENNKSSRKKYFGQSENPR